jgi:hypothetical protein
LNLSPGDLIYISNSKRYSEKDCGLILSIEKWTNSQTLYNIMSLDEMLGWYSFEILICGQIKNFDLNVITSEHKIVKL